MIKKRFISMLVLLAAVVTGAVAQTTYKVSVKEGTEDATSWTIAPAEATTTGVAAGTTVTASYGGVKKVKSVKAVKKAAPAAKAAAEATAEDKGKLIGTDGNIYADVAAATAAGTTAVAMIAYVGSETGEAAPYNHGLALALTDEGQMAWGAAMTACNTTKNTSTPVTGATWLLPSQDQWKQMFKANGGNEGSYTGLNTAITTAGGTTLPWEMAVYWSSSERNPGVYAYYVLLDEGAADCEEYGSESSDNGHLVRACLAF